MSEQHERATLEETLDTINGFDEIAIQQAFGRYFAVLCDDPTMLARAGVFIDKRRAGMKDDEAKEAAMGMPMKEVNAYFPDDEEINPEAPETPAGEDDSPAA